MPDRPLRVAIVADLLEERWPSMDLVADMLMAHLPLARVDRRLHVELLRPTLPARGQGLGRFVNRYWDYPRWLRAHGSGFDVYHVVDHSYAHVVHALPAERTIVTCHDVDAFLPVADPALSRTKLPNALTRRVLSGMRQAAHVTCDSAATYEEAVKYGLVHRDRTTVVPIGTRPGFGADPVPADDDRLDAKLGRREPGTIELLHVGSCIARKRIDLLLRIFTAIRDHEPRARLLKAGGAFTSGQRRLLTALRLDDAVTELPFLDAPQLAALYRRADAVLLTSEREGFGLPVVEALSCGTPVITTDLPVFREVGGDAVTYCAAGECSAWTAAFERIRNASRDEAARARRAGIARASRFSWQECATAMAAIYANVAAGRRISGVRATAGVA